MGAHEIEHTQKTYMIYYQNWCRKVRKLLSQQNGRYFRVGGNLPYYVKLGMSTWYSGSNGTD